MKSLAKSLLNKLTNLIRRPGFWLIIISLLLISIPYYGETLKHPTFLTQIMINLGLSRHSLERILYLAPMVWAGFVFGWKGSFFTSLVALAIMLPRSILSTTILDDVFEAGAVFIIGNVLSITFYSLRKERENRVRLELAQKELQASERRYRELFESAHDAIWIHDMEGNIIAANRAAFRMNGYTTDELLKMNVKSFLSEESLRLASQIRRKLMANEPTEQPYEQHLIRKDKSEAVIHLTTSLVLEDGKPVAFQHIARDVTEERRLQENLRFYLRQASRAQEEERKRISRELHDDTIQALVVLSRQLDAIISSDKGLSETTHQRLEALWKRTNDVMQGVRRLSQDLRPAALDRLGLLSALNWLAADVANYSGLTTKVNVVGTERRLPEEFELVLFRIAQEALRNVWRHAEATQAEMTVEFSDKQIRITVSDNGKGYNLPRTIGDLARDGKLGLAGMQERTQLLGGTLSIKSEPGKGTSVTVEVPI